MTSTVKIISILVLFLYVIQFSTIGHFYELDVLCAYGIGAHTYVHECSFLFLLTRSFSGLGLFDLVRLAGQWAPEISPEL